MNTADPVAAFDAQALRRGIEERDAKTLRGLYAEDAELRVVDRDSQPSSPRTLRGRDAIGDYLDELCARDMTHTVERLSVGADTVSYLQACRYPDGTRVLCSAVLDVRDGLITRQVGVQAWDEPAAPAAPAPAAAAAERRDFAEPDETRVFDKGRLELVTAHGRQIGRLTLEPGWRWSEHVKPLAGTELCEAPHFQYHVAGTLRIVMADGAEFDATPGQVTCLPSGHDAWVVGDEPVVVVDWWGATDYARS